MATICVEVITVRLVVSLAATNRGAQAANEHFKQQFDTVFLGYKQSMSKWTAHSVLLCKSRLVASLAATAGSATAAVAARWRPWRVAGTNYRLLPEAVPAGLSH